MGLEIPNVVHKYDIADFTNYYYWQIYFQDAGSWLINGNAITGVAGTTLEINVTTPPIPISGGTRLYLLGDYRDCVCGPIYPAFTGNTSATSYGVRGNMYGGRYYYGNLGSDNLNNNPR